MFLHGRGDKGEDSNINDEFFRALKALGADAPAVVFPNGGNHGYWHDRRGAKWARYWHTGWSLTDKVGLAVDAAGAIYVTGSNEGADMSVLGQPAAEDPHARVHRFPGHCTSGLTHGGHLLLRDVIHRAAGERNEVPRHLMTPLSAACSHVGLMHLSKRQCVRDRGA